MKKKTYEASLLISIRKQCGFTQTKFASLLHLARGTLANYEGGRQMIPNDRMDDAIELLRKYRPDSYIKERAEQNG